MKIKMKTGKAFDIVNGFGNLKQKRLPIRLSYTLNRNLKQLESAVEIFNDERYKLFEQYGEKDANGKIVVDDNGNVKFSDPLGFSAAINELRDVDVEIPVQKVSIEQFDACDTEQFDSLTPAELDLLDFMIE